MLSSMSFGLMPAVHDVEGVDLDAVDALVEDTFGVTVVGGASGRRSSGIRSVQRSPGSMM